MQQRSKILLSFYLEKYGDEKMKTKRTCSKFGEVSIKENCSFCIHYKYTVCNGIEKPLKCDFQITEE
jgi:hypothetical protein